jgi:non-specific serine/threonine protein kinase/serine/threonine-protein kinase
MDKARWERAKAVFQDVFELDPPARDAALRAACDGDDTLREDVERLLRSHARAQGPLDASPVVDRERDPETEGHLSAGGEAAPARIGPYRVLRALGQGGMGTVYLAERDEPGLHKIVAVKVVRRGMDSEFVVRRFRNERQILAALEHPGIARLYDGGTTEERLPFFVMEYVDGEDLLAYCDARRLTVEARLHLFRRVLGAVQYAHQALVVHRDLKPSNILVTAEGHPKLLDFGIAKLLAPGQAEGAELEETSAAVRLMTPEYASPEQVRGERATTASDVYSLGVVLYELLCGHRPHRLEGRGAAERERAILAEEPAPPSTAATRVEAVSGAGARSRKAATPAEVSERRGVTPARLRRLLKRDLDNVVLKALRKDPRERYATAAELSEDLRCHLEGFPVRALPERRFDRAAKFVRRHRAGVAAAAAVVLSLLTGIAVAVREARIAEAERRRAEARFEDVRRLANSVIYEFHDAIGNLPGATPARRLLVTRALEYLDRLADEARDDPGLKRELADAYRRLGQVQGGGSGANLGDTSGARASLEKALAIREALAKRQPVDPQDALGLALLEFDLAGLNRTVGDVPAAERWLRSAAARLEALRTAGALAADQRGRVAATYQRLADAELFQGKNDAGLVSARRAVEEAEAAAGNGPPVAELRHVLAGAYYQLAEALGRHGRNAEALERSRQARVLLEATLRDDPLNAQQTRVLLYVLNGESNHLWWLGDIPGAIGVRRHALAISEDAQRRDPQDRWSRMAVAVAARSLGALLLDSGDARGSAPLYRRALLITRAAVEEDPRNSYARLEIGSAESGLAKALITQGTPAAVAEGCALLQGVRAFWEGLRAKGQLPPGETEELGELPKWLARCGPRT